MYMVIMLLSVLARMYLREDFMQGLLEFVHCVFMVSAVGCGLQIDVINFIIYVSILFL